MTEWWASDPIVGKPAAEPEWWAGDEVVKAPKAAPVYSGAILPFSRDAQGSVSFDSNAGILGAIKRGLMAPSDAATGKLQVFDPETGRTTEEAQGRAFEAAGVMMPPSLRTTRGLLGGEFLATPTKVKAPTAEALKEAAGAGYDRARDMGVDYAASHVAETAGKLQRTLEADGILAELAPKTFTVARKLQSPPEGAVAPLAGVEAARRALNHAAKDFANPTEQLAASRLVRGLDDFVSAPPPDAVVAGPAAVAGKVHGEARGNYAAAQRSDRLNGIEEAADLRAAAANSGQNTDNAIRGRVASLLLNPKQAAGFSEAELAALTGVVEGTGIRNSARALGNALGGGGGLGTYLTSALGAATGSQYAGGAGAAAGAALPAVGLLSKQFGNYLTRRALAEADEAVRMRSPMGEALQAAAPLQPGWGWYPTAMGQAGLGLLRSADPDNAPRSQSR